MVHTCNPAPEVWRQEDKFSHPQLHSKFQPIVGYMKPCLKEKRKGGRKKTSISLVLGIYIEEASVIFLL